MRHFAHPAYARGPAARRALVVLGTMAALAAGGCSYNLPFFARPGAAGDAQAGATGAAPAASATPRHAKPKRDAMADARSAKSKRASRRRGKDTRAPEPVAAAERPTTLGGKLDEARARAAAAPAEPYWLYHEAELYAAADSLAPAEAALRQTLARDASYGSALALFSKLEYDAGRHDDAIATLESARMAAQRASGDLAPELLVGLALHYDASGRAADAREALAAVPHSAHEAADAAAASVALNGAAGDSAAELAERAVREQPNSAACENNAGISRLRAGDVGGARQALLKAVDLDPRRPGPYYNLTILEKYYALDDEAAASWFAKYRALSSDDPDGLGAALGGAGSKDLAEGSK